MSINVGYLNGKYPNIHNSKNNILTLNSFTTSNVINLNTDTKSYDDIFINFKNRMKVGISSNTYMIHDIINNCNLMSIDEEKIIFNKPIEVTDNWSVGTIFNTSNGTINMNSNINIHLYDPTDAFTITSENSSSAVRIAANEFEIKDYEQNNRLTIEPSKIDIEKDVYINNGTLYVSSIEGIGEGFEIKNAKWDATSIESINASIQLAVINNTSSGDIPSLYVSKKYGAGDIISINSYNSSTTTNNMTLNNNGLLGIGTTTPTACLSIGKSHPNIISYKGDSVGAEFNLVQNGNLGIGTTDPTGQLHIRRNDEPNVNDYRRDPLIKFDMQYLPANNSSNIFTTNTDNKLTDSSSASSLTVMKVISSIKEVNGKMENNFYLVNDNLQQAINNNVDNFSNIQMINSDIAEFDSESDTIVTNFMRNLNPSTVSLEFTGLYIGAPEGGTIPHTFNFMMMSPETKNSGGYNNVLGMGYNASNFFVNDQSLTMYNSIVYKNQENLNIRYVIKFEVEKNFVTNIQTANGLARKVQYDYPYTVISKVTVPEPYFMYMTSNDGFISSISPSGTLSIGSPVPENKKHLNIYTSGSSEINKLYVNNITSFNNTTSTSISFANNGDISFGNANIVNVKTLNCEKIRFTDIAIDDWADIGIDLDNLDDISANTASYKTLTTSNLSFINVNNDYLSISSNSFTVDTKMVLGESDPDDTVNASLKINVTSNVVQDIVTVDGEQFYRKSDGIRVTNTDSNLNPSISIHSDGNTKPYIHMKNGNDGYNLRMNRLGTTSYFQLTNNEISASKKSYYTDDDNTPAILQHTKDDNVLSFGEQNIICIDCDNKESHSSGSYVYTNHSSKVSIGIPYGKLQSEGLGERLYTKSYFKDVLVDQSEYLLHIFGNVRIADIDDNPVFTTKKIDGKGVSVAINGEVDSNYSLKIDGNTYSSNITINGDLNVFNSAGEIVNFTSIINGTSSLKFGDGIWSSNSSYISYSNVQITGDDVNLYHPRNVINSYHSKYEFHPSSLTLDSSANGNGRLLINNGGVSSTIDERNSILFTGANFASMVKEYWNVIDRFTISFWYKTANNYSGDILYLHSDSIDDSTDPVTTTVTSSIRVTSDTGVINFLLNDNNIVTKIVDDSNWNHVSFFVDIQDDSLKIDVNSDISTHDAVNFPATLGISQITDKIDKIDEVEFNTGDAIPYIIDNQNAWTSLGGFNATPGEDAGKFLESKNSFMASQDGHSWEYYSQATDRSQFTDVTNVTDVTNMYDGQKVSFRFSEELIMTSFVIFHEDDIAGIPNAPHAFRLFGSVDEMKWVNIHDASTIAYTNVGGNLYSAEFTISDKIPYKYYALLINKVGTDGRTVPVDLANEFYARIDQIKFYGYSKYINILGSEIYVGADDTRELYISDLVITYGDEPAQDVPEYTRLVDDYYVSNKMINTSNFIINSALELQKLISTTATSGGGSAPFSNIVNRNFQSNKSPISLIDIQEYSLNNGEKYVIIYISPQNGYNEPSAQIMFRYDSTSRNSSIVMYLGQSFIGSASDNNYLSIVDDLDGYGTLAVCYRDSDVYSMGYNPNTNQLYLLQTPVYKSVTMSIMW